MRRQQIAVALVIAAVVVAGCAGGTGDGTTTSPGTTDATTAGTTATTAETTATTNGEVDRSASEIRDAAVAAIEGVDTYRVSSEQESVTKANLVRQSTQVNDVVFDRENRELQLNRTTRAGGRSQQVSLWVVDKTVYSKSESFTRRFGSKWVKVDVSDNYSRYWQLQDTLDRQRAVLENASSLSVAGTETVNGTETVVLKASVSSEDYVDIAGRTIGAGSESSVTVSRADFTFYLSQETDLPVRSTAQINATIETNDRTVRYNSSVTVDYYGYNQPTSIDLPEGAESAVNFSNQTSSPALPAPDAGEPTGTAVGAGNAGTWADSGVSGASPVASASGPVPLVGATDPVVTVASPVGIDVAAAPVATARRPAP